MALSKGAMGAEGMVAKAQRQLKEAEQRVAQEQFYRRMEARGASQGSDLLNSSYVSNAGP